MSIFIAKKCNLFMKGAKIMDPSVLQISIRKWGERSENRRITKRNCWLLATFAKPAIQKVAPRMGRVSWNWCYTCRICHLQTCCAPHGSCELKYYFKSDIFMFTVAYVWGVLVKILLSTSGDLWLLYIINIIILKNILQKHIMYGMI